MKSKKPLTDKELEEWENNRDLGAELLESVRQMKAGKGRVIMSPVISAQKKSGLSQTEFAKLLAYPLEHCRNGNKAVANRAVQLKNSLKLQNVTPMS